MKSIHLILLLLIAVIFISGCVQSGEEKQTANTAPLNTGENLPSNTIPESSKEIDLESCSGYILNANALDVGNVSNLKGDKENIVHDEDFADKVTFPNGSFEIVQYKYLNKMLYGREDGDDVYFFIISHIKFKSDKDWANYVAYLDGSMPDLARQINAEVTNEKRFNLDTLVWKANSIPESKKNEIYSTQYIIKIPSKRTAFTFSTSGRITSQEAETLLKEYFSKVCA